jgi:hypothetical protein
MKIRATINHAKFVLVQDSPGDSGDYCHRRFPGIVLA